MGGILVTSIISFQIILPLQSALVVGSNLILLILYKPTAIQTKFKRMKISFGICRSTFPFGSSNFAKALFTPIIDLTGFIREFPVTEIDHILRLLPDMYIIKEFINTDFPGPVANASAALFFLRAIASARCFSLADISVPVEDNLVFLASFSKTAILFIPRGRGNFLTVEYLESLSFMLRSTDHFLRNEVGVVKKWEIEILDQSQMRLLLTWMFSSTLQTIKDLEFSSAIEVGSSKKGVEGM